MTSRPDGSDSSLAGGIGWEVEVNLSDGSQLRGAVETFNPHQANFFLRTGAGPAPLAILFDDVKTVAFLRKAGSKKRKVARHPSERAITVRFYDGSTLKGITSTGAGGRRGLYLLPMEGDEAFDTLERVFVPVAAVREVVSVEKLGDILSREGMISAELLKKSIKKQQELRQEKIGSVLLRTAALGTDQLSEGLAAQQHERDRRIGMILVTRGFISKDELAEALEVQKGQRSKRLGEIMVEMGLATQKMIAIALAIQFGLPFVDLSAQPFDPRLQVLVPKETAIQYECLPLSLQQGVLTLAIPDPIDLQGRDRIRKATGLTVVVVVAPQHEIARAIARYYDGSPGRPSATP